MAEEIKKKHIELSTSVLKNRVVVDKLWSNYQYTDNDMANLSGVNLFSIRRYTRGESDYRLSDFVAIVHQLGFRVLLEPESDRIDYYDVDTDTIDHGRNALSYRHKPTRIEVFKQLRKWYGDFNQTKMGEALGISQAVISQYLSNKK